MAERRKIFISYRKADTAGVAGRLYDALAGQFGRGLVFRDADAIDEGESITDELLAELDAAAVLLVLVGKNWLKQFDSAYRRRIDLPKDWVRREIEIGLQGDVHVLPVLVDGDAHRPVEDDLPSSIVKLCALKHAVLRSSIWTVRNR